MSGCVLSGSSSNSRQFYINMTFMKVKQQCHSRHIGLCARKLSVCVSVGEISRLVIYFGYIYSRFLS